MSITQGGTDETFGSSLYSTSSSLASIATISAKYYESVQKAFRLPPPPAPGRFVIIMKWIFSWVWWNSWFLLNFFLVIGTIILLANFVEMALYCKIFLCIGVSLDLGFRLVIAVSSFITAEEDESILIMLFYISVMALGREDYLHLHDGLYQEMQSNFLDLFTMVVALCFVPFFSILVQDPQCLADSLCHPLVISLLSAGGLVVVKCLVLLLGFKFIGFRV